MKSLSDRQKGASALGMILFLAVLAYAVFVVIQYTPLFLESKALDSVLRTMESSQSTDRVSSENAARTKVTNLLHINQMSEMTKNLSVRDFNGKITIKFEYDRELNIGYKKQPMHYEKSLVLN